MPSVAGTGFNIVGASHAIYYSRDFNYGLYSQSTERIYRKGQTKKCTYYDIVAKDTIDEYVLKAISKKETLSNKITGDELRKMLKGEML
jgi:SNF2 family DNA or RNA helicase